MSLLYLIFFLLVDAAILKSIFFWVYLWQLKDYRIDRFLAEYGRSEILYRFWLGSGGRVWRKPRWTPKAVLLTVAVLAVFVLFALRIPAHLIVPANVASNIAALINLVLFYLLVPFVVLGAVLILKIPTRFARGAIFRRARMKIAAQKNLLIIGITGSYGKSSTKEFVAQVLSHKWKVAKTPQNVNTEVGISQWILSSLPADAQIAVIEMGAYKRGEIKQTCEIAPPHVGILTGVNEQHLAMMGSLDNIKKTKFELIENLSKSAVSLGKKVIEPMAFFNGEDRNVLSLAEAWTGKGLIYRFPAHGHELPLPRYYSVNLEAAVNVGRYLGMTEAELNAAVKKVEPTDRMTTTRIAADGILVIDDTYSVNPDGAIAALDFLREQNRRFKVAVMPSLIELGAEAAAVHERIGEKIFESCDLAIITTPEHFEDIRRGSGSKVMLAATPDAVTNIFEKFAERKLHRDVAVLLEGRLPAAVISYFEK